MTTIEITAALDVIRQETDFSLGSSDGERKTLLTRQVAFEPLPARG